MKTILALITIALISTAAMADEDAKDRPAYLDEIKKLNANDDRFKAIEYINNHDDAAEIAEIYDAIVIEYYWKDKDIANTIFFAQSGISFLLTENVKLRADDPQTGYEMKKKAKALCYNLSSFCWPGWDEKGIILGKAEIAIGLDAAEANLRIAKELGEKGLSISYDYWMLGASQLAVQEYVSAKTSFELAKKSAHDEGDLLNELLAEGYIAATMVIEGAPDGRKMLGEVLNRLIKDGSEDALYFVDQINSVINLFVKK